MYRRYEWRSYSPAIALQYLDRMQQLLMEVLPTYDCPEVRRMIAKSDELAALLLMQRQTRPCGGWWVSPRRI